MRQAATTVTVCLCLVLAASARAQDGAALRGRDDRPGAAIDRCQGLRVGDSASGRRVARGWVERTHRDPGDPQAGLRSDGRAGRGSGAKPGSSPLSRQCGDLERAKARPRAGSTGEPARQTAGRTAAGTADGRQRRWNDQETARESAAASAAEDRRVPRRNSLHPIKFSRSPRSDQSRYRCAHA